MKAFIGGTGVGIFPNVNDEDAEIWARYGIGYQPAFVFIDDSGTTSTFASLNESDIQDKIDTLF